jgi:hypothetical protein
MVLLLAGCGGRQNPVRLDAGGNSSFFNGAWDGFTIPVVFIIDISHKRDYRYYNHAAPNIYFLGYILGAALMIAVILAIVRSIRLRAF